tara:strand:+ start:482 stop:955 length:474 start_codon:yes stop_codon:yes gene_type:complete
MESLLAQIESWVIGLIDKRIDTHQSLFEETVKNDLQPITTDFEEDVKTIVNKMNTTPNTFENEIFKKLIQDVIDENAQSTMDVETAVDAVIEEKIIDHMANNFDITDYDSGVETIIDNIIGDKIVDNFDISNYESEIAEAIDNKLEDVEFNITASIH